ncbi:MAG: MOSC domain-containing protein [Rhodospirillaceae bacterium]|jgi:MOSC domain-containing protein YiiM
MTWSGRLEFIHAAEKAAADMQELTEGTLIAGKGLEGDRYCLGIGEFSHKDVPGRHLTLIESEVLDALKRDHNVDLAPHESRRNLTVRDVPLTHLVGKKFKVGDAVLLGVRINEPCRYLEGVLNKKIVTVLLHRSGLNCNVIEGGVIRPGDVVEPLN